MRVCVRSFTKDLAPQGEAFTRDLKFEKKSKAPLFPGPKVAGDTNCWYIRV